MVLEPRPLTTTSVDGEDNQTTGTSLLEAVYVSHGAKFKNHENVLRAIPLLRDFGIHVRLTLVGGFGSERQRALRRKMDQLGILANEVVFAGQLPPEDVFREISRSDFVIFASRAESLSYSLLEAIRSKKPIACSSSSALPEILGQHGFYFDANNPVSIAIACRRLVAEFDETVSVTEDLLPETTSSRGARIRSEFFTGIRNFFAQHGQMKGTH